MRMFPPIRLENGDSVSRNHNPIQRWPDRDGYRAAERLSDIAMMPADEAPNRPVDWLWPDTIPRGHLTLVAGEPGCGKSFWMADLAGRVTFDRTWPYSQGRQMPYSIAPPTPREPDARQAFAMRNGSVVFVNSDDSFSDVQRPRLTAADAQLPLVGMMRRMPPGSRFSQIHSVGPVTDRLQALRTAVKEAGDCKLAIVDDLARFVRNGLGKVTRADLMLAIESLRCMAAECEAAMIVVWRLERTGRSTARMLETLLPAAAAAWLVADDPYRPKQRWAISLKNQFGPPPEPMAFHIADNHIVWDVPPPTVPADVMAAFVRKSDRRLEREQAGRWALERLAEGPVEANRLFDDAEACGFSRRTVRRALVDLGLKPTKLGNDGPWCWGLGKAEGKRRKAEGEGDVPHESADLEDGLPSPSSAELEDGQVAHLKEAVPASGDGADAQDADVAENDNGKMVVVTLNRQMPGAEFIVEDGQLGAHAQTSGP